MLFVLKYILKNVLNMTRTIELITDLKIVNTHIFIYLCRQNHKIYIIYI